MATVINSGGDSNAGIIMGIVLALLAAIVIYFVAFRDNDPGVNIDAPNVNVSAPSVPGAGAGD